MPEVPLVIVPDEEVCDGGDVMVEARIGGQPYRLRLDTGAARTELVADDYLAAQPGGGQHPSAGVFGQQDTGELVTIPGLTTGDLATGPLQVVRAVAAPGRQHLLGMDLLGRYCCEFRFGDRLLLLTDSPDPRASLDLPLGDRGHIFAALRFDQASASACWDSGAGVSVVDQAFTAAHPHLFTPAGEAIGTDSTMAQFSTPLMTMAGPVIAGVQFAPSTVAVIDLGPVNQGLAVPMDLIAGYPLLRQADWLFDIPARRFAAPKLLGR